MLRLRLVALAVLAVILPSAGCGLTEDTGEFMRAMSYAGYSPGAFSTPASDSLLSALPALGVNWIVLIPQWYQDDLSSTQIAPWRGHSPSDASLRHAVRLAHHLGLKVMLKPFLDPRRGGWRARIQPADWGPWFASYRRFIDHYADFARAEGCEALVVGVELSSSDASRTADWREVIHGVRSRYGGLLTYAADWPQYRRIRFWDDLDAIGVDAYFPLSRLRRPSVEALRLGWLPWMRQITRFLRDHPRQRVIFTEIGYPSRVGAARNPAVYDPGATADPGLQARLYEAVFGAPYHEPWLYGLCWFWWDNPSVPDFPGGPSDIGFTPRGKPAEKVLRRHFTSPRMVLPRAI